MEWHSHSWLCKTGLGGHTMAFYRRNLPHWHPEGRVIFVTWRLHGSLPKGYLSGTATLGCAGTGKSAGATKTTDTNQGWGKRFRTVDAELDRGARGPLWLRDPAIAGYVEAAIIRGAELGQYELRAYVVMPNHVHALLQPNLSLARITGGIKGVSARDANATLGRVGEPFWQDESFDHWVRNGVELGRIRRYIERNPVTAGLAEKPEDWPWSSARRKDVRA